MSAARWIAGASVVLAGAGWLGGCSGSASSPPPPAAIVALVPGPASAYASIAVVGSGSPTPVPPAWRTDVAPLLVARVFSPGGSLAPFGLRQPRAYLHYRRSDGSTIDVALGDPTFDRHFVYARRAGAPTIALVAASVADPLLALVGVHVPPPT
jgi:hypothetical protein